MSSKPEINAEYLRKKAHVQQVQRMCGRLLDKARQQVRLHDADKLAKLKSGEVVDKDVHRLSQPHHLYGVSSVNVSIVDLIEAASDIAAVIMEKGEPGVLVVADEDPIVTARCEILKQSVKDLLGKEVPWTTMKFDSQSGEILSDREAKSFINDEKGGENKWQTA